MATNMPPHNLSEVVDGTIKYIENKGNIEVSDLIQHIKAQTFQLEERFMDMMELDQLLKQVEVEL